MHEHPELAAATGGTAGQITSVRLPASKESTESCYCFDLLEKDPTDVATTFLKRGPKTTP